MPPILTAVWPKSLHLLPFRVPKGRKVHLGRRLSDAAQTYADIVAIPYLVTFGLNADRQSIKHRARPGIDC
jgi:hypothetical protein